MAKKRPSSVFVSYSHEDSEVMKELLDNLKTLTNQGIVGQIWSDREIEAGKDWEREIIENLEKADIILLLVSKSFLRSEYCIAQELNKAMSRHNKESFR